MKKIATIAAIAALTTLAACGTAEAPAEVTATEAVATDAATAVDPNLQQVCDSQTPTAACDVAVTEEAAVASSVKDAVEAAPAADSK
jgi:hypothetical protein